MRNLSDSDVYGEIEPQGPQDLEDFPYRLPDDYVLLPREPAWTRLVNKFRRAFLTILGQHTATKERRLK